MATTYWQALTIRGYGMAGDGRSVERVDVSVDDGLTWQQPTPHAPRPASGSWRPWSLTVDGAGAVGYHRTCLGRYGALQFESAVSS